MRQVEWDNKSMNKKIGYQESTALVGVHVNEENY